MKLRLTCPHPKQTQTILRENGQSVSNQQKSPPPYAGGFFETYFFFGLPQHSLNCLPEPHGHLSVGLGAIFFTSFMRYQNMIEISVDLQD